MTEDLDERLRHVPAADAPALIALGRELLGAGRLPDAESCFRRAAALGDAVAAFALGNTLAAQERWTEASVAYEAALAGGESDACLIYDMDVASLGTLRVAEHFLVADDRIVRIRQIHDTATLRRAGFGPPL